MTQEDKELLLKDLCARLPYGVKVESVYINPDTKERKSHGIEVFDATDILVIKEGFGEFKPYLFPLSSMTEEQKKELNKKFNVQLLGNTIYSIHYHSEGCWDTDLELDLQDWLWFINWCYKNHFDICGLIKKGLAIDATGLNIY